MQLQLREVNLLKLPERCITINLKKYISTNHPRFKMQTHILYLEKMYMYYCLFAYGKLHIMTYICTCE